MSPIRANRKKSPGHGPGPVIGLTLGDPAGIGPELVFDILRRRLFPGTRILVIANRSVLERLRCPLPLNEIRDPAADAFRKGALNYFEVAVSGHQEKFGPGRPSRWTSSLSYAFIVAGARLALDGTVDALVTNPVNKENIVRAGRRSFLGHTELLASLSGVRRFNMVFAGRGGVVGLVTTHCPLGDVPGLVTRASVSGSIANLSENAGLILNRRPSIAVLGLNPHAGEAGLFGTEEKRGIAPAIMASRRKGIRVEGPFPADSFWSRVWPTGRFNTVLAMYHDQGLIPVKNGVLGPSVNITLGLPFPRVSVDHGTAYDIAGRGKADPAGLETAIGTAVRLSGKYGRSIRSKGSGANRWN